MADITYQPDNITDTGAPWIPPREGVPSVVPNLAPSMRRALTKRVRTLEAEQAATFWLIERLYDLSDELTYDYLEKHQRLRQMRAIVMNAEGSA